MGLTVTPASLTITAQDQSKVYGTTASLGTLAFTTAGLVNADSVSGVTLTSPGSIATASVLGGPYAITPSAAQGSGLSNYAISYVNAPVGLTVFAAPELIANGAPSLGTSVFPTSTQPGSDGLSGLSAGALSELPLFGVSSETVGNIPHSAQVEPVDSPGDVVADAAFGLSPIGSGTVPQAGGSHSRQQATIPGHQEYEGHLCTQRNMKGILDPHGATKMHFTNLCS